MHWRNDSATGSFIDEGIFATITNANFSRLVFIEYIKTEIEKRDALKNQVLDARQSRKGAPFSETLPKCATWRPTVTVQPATIAEIGTDIVNRHRGLNNGGHDVGETRGAAA